MGQLVKLTLPVVLVVLSSVFLCVTVPLLILIEVFFIIIGMLLIASIWLMLIEEVGKLIDLRHRNRIQRESYSGNVQKHRQRRLLRRRVTTRARGYYH